MWWGAVLLFDLGALALLVDHRPLAALVVFLVPMPCLLPPLVVPSSAGFGPVVTRFSTERREVWLTIDDGPDPVTTPPVLALLDDYQARATFFLIGAKVARHPALVAEILRRGHTVGNHTDQHPCFSFWCASPQRVANEIDRCNEALRRAGAGPQRWFRPPVGIKSPFLHRQLAARGLDLIMWSARGYDSVRSPAAALAKITRELKPGAIILVHETSRAGASHLALLTQLLDQLAQGGYTCVIPPAGNLRSGRSAA